MKADRFSTGGRTRSAMPAIRAARLFLAAPLIVFCFIGAACASPASSASSASSAKTPAMTAVEVPTPAAPPADQTLKGAGAAGELDALKADFDREVRAKTEARLRKHGAKAKKPDKRMAERLARLESIDPAYERLVAEDAFKRLELSGARFDSSQYFVYVDAARDRQLGFLAYYDADAPAGNGRGTIVLIGADLVSTGKLRAGEDSFVTPTGTYENLLDNFGYRAQGTKNSKGWRGLGAKGSRVWDFGFQQGLRQFSQGVHPSQMRLLMHATDPDFGEPRLGAPDSKGCVRVSAQFNRFLDSRAVLDKHYEEFARANPATWLLRPDRTPVSRPGSLLIIGNTENAGSAENASGTPGREAAALEGVRTN